MQPKAYNQSAMSKKTPTEMSQHNQTLRHTLVIVFLLTNLIYLGWRLFYTLPIGYGWLSLIVGLSLFIAELTGFLENAVFYISLWDIRSVKTPATAADDVWPSVDVFVATYNEPMDILYKTLNGCVHLEYPDPTKVNVYLLDDGDRPEAKALAQSFNVHYIAREDNQHAKAGNLNHALLVTRGDLIVTLDADMIPQRSFLVRTIPFFMKDEKMAFVQTPQSFYNPDTFQYNLFMEQETPNEQDLFFRLVQTGRSRYNAAIYAGSNTVLSRKALESVGNFAIDTVTEDFATGMKLQAAGFRSVYLNEILASGLSPNTLIDVYNQRVRWASGVVEIILNNNPFFQKGFSLMQKLLYSATISYWFFGIRRLIYITAPLFYILMGVTVLKASVYEVLIFWAPMYLVNHYTFRYFSENVRSATWSNIYETILAPQIAISILKQMVGIRVRKFKVTPKEKIHHTEFIQRYELVVTQIVLLILSITAIVRLALMFYQGTNLDIYSVNLFWLFFNSYILTMTLLYAKERPVLRDSIRFRVNIPVWIDKGEVMLHALTDDISEGGFSVRFAQAHYFEKDTPYHVHLQSAPYKADMHAILARTYQDEDGFNYAFLFSELSQQSWRSTLQIIYDRVPPLPRTHQSKNPFSSILMVLLGQTKDYSSINRMTQRLDVNHPIAVLVDNQPAELHCLDFNFQVVRIQDQEALPSRFSIQLLDGRRVECELDTELSQRRNQGSRRAHYYRLVNFETSMEAYLAEHFNPQNYIT